MSILKLAGVIKESIVDGPGIRFTVFVQGCPHHCPGCHNPQTWAYEGGSEASPGKIIAEMNKNPLLRGVTLSGGEPFCQSKALAELAEAAHKEPLPGGRRYDVVAYTGFTFEQLLKKSKKEPEIRALLKETDLLVDGPFIEELKSYDLLFKGSSNQRLIDVKASLESGNVKIKEFNE